MDGELIGRYSIRRQSEFVVIKYNPSFKDLLDIFIVLFVGLGSSLITYFILQQIIEDLNWMIVVLFIAFLLISIYKIIDLFTRIFLLQKNRLKIDKSNRVISIRSPFRQKRIEFSEIQVIQLTEKKEELLTVHYLPVKRIYCSIEIIDNLGRVNPILSINTTKILRSSDREVEVEVYSIGKKIATRIATEIEKKIRVQRFV